jgi:hypothetical protein
VSHSNLSHLHPVWRKALCFQEPDAVQTLDTNSPWARTDLAQAVAVMTATSTDPSGTHHGWQATNRPHRHGAPVGIKKPLGPGLWASTVARPGDARYPAEFITHS